MASFAWITDVVTNKIRLSYSLIHQLLANKRPVEIGIVISKISQNSQTDRQNYKKKILVRVSYIMYACSILLDIHIPK